MIVLKVICSVLFMVTTILKYGADYWYKDKRTKMHKRARGAFLWVSLLAGFATSFVVLFDSLRSSHTSDEQRRLGVGGGPPTSEYWE